MKLCLAIVLVFLPVRSLSGQSTDKDRYSRKNTFAVFGEYSNDSSHIILGVTPGRKLSALGLQYERRLVNGPRFRLGYDLELRPLILESDTAEVRKGVQTGAFSGTFVSSPALVLRCKPNVQVFTGTANGVPFTDTTTTTCSRVTTFEQGFSPVGLRANFFPRHRAQLILSSNDGYMFATRHVPVDTAGSFNFTFEFGAGLEYFYASKRSIRLEYQVQHYSNHFTADANPGADNGIVKLTYAFGRLGSTIFSVREDRLRTQRFGIVSSLRMSLNCPSAVSG